MGEKLIHIYELEKLAASTIVFHILKEEHRVYFRIRQEKEKGKTSKREIPSERKREI